MAETDIEAKRLKTKRPIQEKARRLKAIFANRYLLTFGKKLLLILAEELLRWLARG